jgi:hypothetical protein
MAGPFDHFFDCHRLGHVTPSLPKYAEHYSHGSAITTLLARAFLKLNHVHWFVNDSLTRVIERARLTIQWIIVGKIIQERFGAQNAGLHSHVGRPPGRQVI